LDTPVTPRHTLCFKDLHYDGVVAPIYERLEKQLRIPREVLTMTAVIGAAIVIAVLGDNGGQHVALLIGLVYPIIGTMNTVRYCNSNSLRKRQIQLQKNLFHPITSETLDFRFCNIFLNKTVTDYRGRMSQILLHTTHGTKSNRLISVHLNSSPFKRPQPCRRGALGRLLVVVLRAVRGDGGLRLPHLLVDAVAATFQDERLGLAHVATPGPTAETPGKCRDQAVNLRHQQIQHDRVMVIENR
jgi:hypothetical protein